MGLKDYGAWEEGVTNMGLTFSKANTMQCRHLGFARMSFNNGYAKQPEGLCAHHSITDFP